MQFIQHRKWKIGPSRAQTTNFCQNARNIANLSCNQILETQLTEPCNMGENDQAQNTVI